MLITMKLYLSSSQVQVQQQELSDNMMNIIVKKVLNSTVNKLNKLNIKIKFTNWTQMLAILIIVY